MIAGERWRAALAIALLPVGGAIALVSALGAIGLLFLAVITFILGLAGAGTLPIAAWSFIAGVVLAWAAVAAIEMVDALDWYPLPHLLAAIALAAAACPLWSS